MPPDPEPGAPPAGQPAAAAGRAVIDLPGRGWLRTLAAAAILSLLALSAGLLWVQREAALDRAQAQAQREVRRLAAELEQSLRLAQASLPQVSSGVLALPAQQQALVGALSLPFDIRSLPNGPAAAEAAPAGQWQPELARPAGERWELPLRWRRPDAQGGGQFEMTLQRDAVLARFASEGMPPGGSMSLFRLEDDGDTTILVRHPLVPREQGLRLRGHVADALRAAPAGVIQVTAQIDGVHRIVGFQRLAAPADRLVVVYALPVQDVLATWTAVLPFAVLLTLLVAAAMAYGARRLDRSVQALRRSEQHFQTLTEHMPDVVVRYDRDGRVLYVNPAVARANGIEPEQMIGRRFSDFGTPPEMAKQWMACLRRVFDSGLPEVLYFTYPGPEGERHWEAQVSPEPAQDGDPPTVLVINRDITGRIEAENRQRAAQRLFETVFQTAPEAMSLSEWETGRFLLVNDAFCSLFGRSRETLIGATATGLGLWRSADNRQRVLAALVNGEPVRDQAGSSVRPDGQTIQMRYSAERVVVDGQTRLLLMFRDVTQLEREQRALARSEQRFRLAAAHGQVWEWDFGRGVVQASVEFFVALGHPAPSQDEMGERFLALLHPDDVPRLRQMLRNFFKGQDDYRLEFRARDAQGRYHWFDTRGSGLRDESGRVIYMAGTTFDVTDRKALEEAQRQTLAELQTVANASPALIWCSDPEGQFTWFNQSWLDFTGRSLAQETGSGWLSGVHPEDVQAGGLIYERALRAREAFQMEYRLRRHDGQYRRMLSQGKPRYNADHRFIGYIGSCLDVTDLREAEATALERGAIMEQVFGVVQDMLFLVDDQERFVFFQAGSRQRLYRPPEEFLGQPMGEVMPPDLVPLLRAAMNRARSSGAQELDYSLPLPDGLHHFDARLAWLPGGRQCMFLVRDITEQQAARQARERLNDVVFLLFRLASRFINLPLSQMDRAIDAALGDMGGFVGADRVYLFAYDMAAQTASNTHEWCGPGITPHKDDLQGLPVDMIPEWFHTHCRGERVHVPDVQVLPEGALRELLNMQGVQSLLALPLMDGPQCLGFVGLDSVREARSYGSEEITLLELFAQMIVNMQLRTRAAQQVREMTEQLEHKVEERTRQLNDSVQRLQAVNRELESFNYSASHDLRTPLRGIEGFSTLLLEEHAQQLDEQGREYLQRIQRATRHMSQLVSDLLAYSRLPQATEHIEPVDVAATVQAVLQPFRDELSAREGRVTVEVPDGLAVRADPQGLAIVLRNLVDNALKFTPADQAPQVRIAACTDGQQVRLSVTDRGMGFDMRHHDRIFGMFQRLHRQDQIPGTGIGLALVHKAVERMGGGIRAESAPGQGASFTIELPLA